MTGRPAQNRAMDTTRVQTPLGRSGSAEYPTGRTKPVPKAHSAGHAQSGIFLGARSGGRPPGGSGTMIATQREPAHERIARVLLVDDHRTFTDLLELALRGETDLEFVGAAHRAAEAEAMVRTLRPDVVVMDVNIGPDDGIELTARLTAAHPGLCVVVLTAHA